MNEAVFSAAYTFVPSGNIEHSASVLGVGEMLLRIAEEDRANLGLPFFSKNMQIDNGLTEIRVLASESNNSRIDIYSEVPEEEEKIHTETRKRLLHCKLIITLADELEDADPADGDVAYPYQGDPSFIVVAPIPVKEDEKIYLHTTFEVDDQRGLVIEGLNGEGFLDTVEDVSDAKKGDEGRELSLDDAKILIEAQTDYKYVDKLLDDDDNVVPVIVPHETILPEEAVSGTTEFNKLFDSSLMTHLTETLEHEGYDYAASVSGDIRIMSNPSRTIREPVETEQSPVIWNEDDDPADLHLIMDVASYIDTIEEDIGGDDPNTPQNEDNIHPLGNINGVKLRHCYGMLGYLSAPFMTITTDFTPRTDDLVCIGDIGTAATRKRTAWLNVWDGDQWNKVFPDAKILATVMPYYVEAKAAEDLRDDFISITAPWNYYSTTPTEYVISWPVQIEGDPEDPSDTVYYTDFYVAESANWFLHPFRDQAWGLYLRDFYTLADGLTERAGNPFFADTGMIINPHRCYADLPNRMILCIRSFFANTDTATTFAGKRRSYDIKYPSFLWNGSTHYGNRPYEYSVPGTFDEIDTETSAPLSIKNSPNFTTIKGDVVVINLLSSIYAVSDYEEVVNADIALSPRHGGITLVEDSPVPVSDVVTKRPWPAILDGNWGYTNIYSAGITVDSIGNMRNRYLEFSSDDSDYPKRVINSSSPSKYVERATRGESIYSDDEEDVSLRYIADQDLKADVTWREEDTPESHLIHCIYRALIKAGYDRHHPVCDIRIEANLYDKYDGVDV